MVAKNMVDTCLEHAQMEGNDEGGMELLLGFYQATMIDEQMSSRTCLQNADQREFGSVAKGL